MVLNVKPQRNAETLGYTEMEEGMFSWFYADCTAAEISTALQKDTEGILNNVRLYSAV
jgi:hypothetical protein